MTWKWYKTINNEWPKYLHNRTRLNLDPRNVATLTATNLWLLHIEALNNFGTVVSYLIYAIGNDTTFICAVINHGRTEWLVTIWWPIFRCKEYEFEHSLWSCWLLNLIAYNLNENDWFEFRLVSELFGGHCEIISQLFCILQSCSSLLEFNTLWTHLSNSTAP